MNEIMTSVKQSFEMLSENHGINPLSKENGPEHGMAMLRSKSALQEAAETIISEEAGLTESEKVGFVQYALNSAEDFLSEATMSQDIQPFAALQLILLKEIYARQIGRRLVNTEILSTPEETTGTFHTVMTDAAGNEHQLNKIDSSSAIDSGWKQEVMNVPFADENFFDPANHTLTAEEQAVQNKSLDIATGVVAVEMEHFDNTGASAGNKIVNVEVTFGEDEGFVRKVQATHIDGTITEDRIFGTIDYRNGKMSIQTEKGFTKKVTLRWRLSNSFAEINTYELELKYEKTRISVDDGDLYNVGIPLNYLQDVKAFFNIDGMSQAVQQIASAINIIDDRNILNTVKNAVVGDATRTSTFDYVRATGITRVEHNKELLEAINRSIAISDDNTQFKTVSEYNIACNPVDAAKVTSPILIDHPNMSNTSITSGALSYRAVPMASPQGTINLLSTKQMTRGEMIVVPKSSAKEERIVSKFKYSSVVYQNNEYKTKKNANIRNVVARHREKITVFEGQAITMVEILHP